MIRLILGNVGSGKTAMLVRELVLNPSHRTTFSNIKTPKIKNNIKIDASMIIEKTVEYSPRGKEIVKRTLNEDFWKKTVKKHKAINVVIDEAHTVLNPRRAMSKTNVIMSEFLALIRRVIGQAADGYGELVLITQLERRLDPIAKEMATKVQFCVCHYLKTCKKCMYSWQENNEMAQTEWTCPSCGGRRIIKHTHTVEVWSFKNIRNYEAWRDFGAKSFYERVLISGMDDFFPYYDTMQWDSLVSDYD